MRRLALVGLWILFMALTLPVSRFVIMSTP
jgi:hypothetical protein